MSHWLKRALLTAALASGLVIATAAVAAAATVGGTAMSPEAIIDQVQEGTNSNETRQRADAAAETNQVNVFVPVAVLSHGSNNGDVEQSNDADTTAAATNSNSTGQSVDQDQAASGGDGCGKCRSGGAVSQSQQAENRNRTEQDADATAETNQVNVAAPVTVFSRSVKDDKSEPAARDKAPYGDDKDRRDKRHRGDGVEQSNDAETTAVAANGNSTSQSIDQDQLAEGPDGDKAHHGDEKPRCDVRYGDKPRYGDRPQAGECSDGKPRYRDKPRCGDRPQAGECSDGKPRYRDKRNGDERRCGCGDGSVQQSQEAGNDNRTEQHATATAETNQHNVYVPIALLSHGSNGGDVEQSNDADTTASAGNHNSTWQLIDQDQRTLRHPPVMRV